VTLSRGTPLISRRMDSRESVAWKGKAIVLTGLPAVKAESGGSGPGEDSACEPAAKPQPAREILKLLLFVLAFWNRAGKVCK
jgi:hypothetical protein